MAGLGANFEFDLRRIIALSTLSQLGLMIITNSIGLSGFGFFFHLLTHAFFKALLFMCARGVVHSVGHSEDIRFIGGLSIYIHFTSSSLTFGTGILYLTLRLLMSYIHICMEHPFLMFLDHTQRRTTVGRTPLDE